MNIDLLTVVYEDLKYLFEDWNQDIDDSSLRRSSPVLRSLLVEGQLMKVAKQLNSRVRIIYPAIFELYPESELKNYEIYISGGATQQGMMIQTFYKTNRVLSEVEYQNSYQRRKATEGKFLRTKLDKFLRQTSIASNGTLVNREEIIKYVANKLGGAHFDSTRADRTGKSNDLNKKYMLLDNIKNNIAIANKNSIYFELLSIGQCVVNSRDVQKLQKKLQHLLSLPKIIYA